MAARTQLIALLGCVALGCAGLVRPALPRVSELVDAGDARYRASQRLVVEGLDADRRGQVSRARSRYQRALQVDSSNPWIYLALARHHVESKQPERALSHLDHAEALFDADQAMDSPGARVHRDGLRGAALAQLGREQEAQPLLDSAARRAPRIWGDRRLDAAELR